MEPYIKTFILCDSVNKDISGKPIFVGILNKLKAVSYPSYVPICIVTEWVVGEGNYKEDIKVLTGQKDYLYFEIAPHKFNCNESISIKRSVKPLKNFPLAKPGYIWFQAYMNDKLYCEFPIIIETKVSRILGGKKL